MATCESCGADILWTYTETGKRMPVDAHPVAGGNLIVTTGQGERADLLRASVVGSTIDLTNPYDTGVRHLSHFATCPNANQHRKRKQ